jgi:SH3-like domain-containing protein
MRRIAIVILAAVTASAALFATAPQPASAQAAKGATGLPIPRFVSLKSKRVNLRIGPGKDYAVSWLYMKAGLPVEIIQEYDNWRKVRDADGTEGWVNHSLLSGERSALAAPWMRGKGADVFVDVHRDPSGGAGIIARMQPGVVFKIDECNGEWCHGDADGSEGWVNQTEIWGAYPGEAFK